MKIIVTHTSPDMDAITSVWLIRKFLPNWNDASIRFVPAGERLGRSSVFDSQLSDISQPVGQLTGKLKIDKLETEDRQQKTDNRNPIENVGEDEVIHVDTGLGLLDHHQTSSDKVCGASLTFDYVKRVESSKLKVKNSEKREDRMDAVSRMVKVVVDIDHFTEVFRKDPLADYHEFDLAAILDGLKLQFPGQDDYYVAEVSKALDAILHEFENRIWAEKEIKENGKKFETRFGKGIGFETVNDSVVKLSQKMGYVIAVRKDPRKGYVRVKARPSRKLKVESGELKNKEKNSQFDDIDLTLAYEKLKKMDPQATWFLHIGKKMLLNGSVKNPKMRPTTLSLEEIIDVLKKV